MCSQEYVDKLITNIESAFTKSEPLFQDTLLFRGTDLGSPFIKKLIDNGDIYSLKGKVISQSSYMSTSFSKEAACDFIDKAKFGDGALITIKANKGSQVLDMCMVNGNIEAEALVRKGSNLFVEDVQEIIVNGQKRYNIIAILSQDDLKDIGPELALFGTSKIFNKNNSVLNLYKNTELTTNQIETVKKINEYIDSGKNCVVTYNSTAELSSTMLDKINDLSKVEIKLLDGLGDGNGILKSKYLGNQKYDSRITYSGYEMKSIINKIEYLQAKVNMQLALP